MPGLFDGELFTDILEDGSDELEGNAFTLNKPIKDGVIYLDSAGGTSNWKLQIAFWNGTSFMKYHTLKEDDLNENMAAGDSAEFGIKVQEFWKEPVFGLKLKAVRIDGSGDITFTNAQVDYLQ